jgi:hypothetical protein
MEFLSIEKDSQRWAALPRSFARGAPDGNGRFNTLRRVFLQQVQMEPEDGVYRYYQSVKHSLDVQAAVALAATAVDSI